MRENIMCRTESKRRPNLEGIIMSGYGYLASAWHLWMQSLPLSINFVLDTCASFSEIKEYRLQH